METCNDPKLVLPAPKLDDIVAAIEKFAKEPRLIGHLHGYLVWVNPAMPWLNIEFRDAGGMVLLRAPVDHPYLKGTKLERVARAALGLET